MIVLPEMKVDAYKNFFFPSVIKLWNQLDDDITKAYYIIMLVNVPLRAARKGWR